MFWLIVELFAVYFLINYRIITFDTPNEALGFLPAKENYN